uniref:Lipocalin n=1 Tax=Rhipicephalus appendiculatus TaxID=34631 RepID=A0A131Z0Z1_RHIAP
MTEEVVSCYAMHMLASLLTLILIFTDSTSSIGCLPKSRPTIYSMINFVNTTQRVWTYKISRPGTIRCQYNLKRVISPHNIVYNRTFLHNRQRHSIILRGEFHARPRDRMDVNTIDGATYYELRVKNAYVESVPDRRCGRHFNCVARSGIFTYGPDCQNMTRPRK